MNSSTINKDEMEMFDKYSLQWWDVNGPAKILHDIKKILIPYVRESLTKAKLTMEHLATSNAPLKNVKILDAGCGGGIVAESFAELGATVVGLDVISSLIEVAKKHASSYLKSTHNINYLLEAVEEHAKTNCGNYDAVISNFVVEHINDVEIYLKACAKCVKPGGLIFVSTIGQTIMGWLLGITLPENVFNLFPKGSHEYAKFVNFSDTEKILNEANCVTVEGRGLLFDTNQFNWFWINDTSAYYIIQSLKQ
ncbi:hypothetical protein RN001_000390 [Aquatica leii]|uniref:Ubiquinone biosynthesis O-methyltransferase, mitochondrial n=1 Tax=Aquatica leii TaxID=1421715 RepID=A0AAN7Q2X6_9COLE|nr:hypothetical protein RN001_000390 [Aquatica leii]